VRGSRVLALGHDQPPKVLTNDDLAQIVATDDAWIRSRVGIATRHIADGETVDELAARAAEKALSAAGMTGDQIDLIIVATCTALNRCPNMATRVAARLGVRSPAAFDLNAACSGFSYALASADHALRAGSATAALVIGAEVLSGVTDWTDRNTCVLVGDGAGAAVVVPSEEPGIGPVLWGSVPELGAAIRIEGTPPVFAQEGQTVFRWATTAVADLARQACEKAGITPAELEAFVPHQANLRIIEPAARKLGFTGVLARDVIESGNTSAASVPLALSKLVDRGEIRSGAPVLLFGFGGGLTYAGQVIRCP